MRADQPARLDRVCSTRRTRVRARRGMFRVGFLSDWFTAARLPLPEGQRGPQLAEVVSALLGRRARGQGEPRRRHVRDQRHAVLVPGGVRAPPHLRERPTIEGTPAAPPGARRHHPRREGVLPAEARAALQLRRRGPAPPPQRHRRRRHRGRRHQRRSSARLGTADFRKPRRRRCRSGSTSTSATSSTTAASWSRTSRSSAAPRRASRTIPSVDQAGAPADLAHRALRPRHQPRRLLPDLPRRRGALLEGAAVPRVHRSTSRSTARATSSHAGRRLAGRRLPRAERSGLARPQDGGRAGLRGRPVAPDRSACAPTPFRRTRGRGLSAHAAFDIGTLRHQRRSSRRSAPQAPWTLYLGLGYAYDARTKAAAGPRRRRSSRVADGAGAADVRARLWCTSRASPTCSWPTPSSPSRAAPRRRSRPAPTAASSRVTSSRGRTSSTSRRRASSRAPAPRPSPRRRPRAGAAPGLPGAPGDGPGLPGAPGAPGAPPGAQPNPFGAQPAGDAGCAARSVRRAAQPVRRPAGALRRPAQPVRRPPGTRRAARTRSVPRRALLVCRARLGLPGAPACPALRQPRRTPSQGPSYVDIDCAVESLPKLGGIAGSVRDGETGAPSPARW